MVCLFTVLSYFIILLCILATTLWTKELCFQFTNKETGFKSRHPLAHLLFA